MYAKRNTLVANSYSSLWCLTAMHLHRSYQEDSLLTDAISIWTKVRRWRVSEEDAGSGAHRGSNTTIRPTCDDREYYCLLETTSLTPFSVSITGGILQVMLSSFTIYQQDLTGWLHLVRIGDRNTLFCLRQFHDTRVRTINVIYFMISSIDDTDKVHI